MVASEKEGGGQSAPGLTWLVDFVVGGVGGSSARSLVFLNFGAIDSTTNNTNLLVLYRYSEVKVDVGYVAM